MTRLVLERIAEASARRTANTTTLLDRAAARGAFPILYRYLGYRGAALPAITRRHWLEHVARLSLYRQELARVHDVLEPGGPVVVLKGEPLSTLLYGDGLLRNTTDMDLLISPARIDEAIASVTDLGYRPIHRESAKTWAYNQYALAHETYGTLIELHWRIAFPHLASPPIAELLDQTVPVTVGERVYRSLNPELLLIHLCYHFHQHRGFLKGLLDIAGWIDRFEDTADLREISKRARDLGIWGVVQWPLHTLKHLTGYQSRLYEPTDDPFVKAWGAWSAAKIDSDFVELCPTNHFEAWLGEHGFGAKIAGSLFQGLSMLVVDGGGRKLATAVRPVVFGPHRLGRAVFAGLERLGVVEREELFEGRIFA